MKHQTPCFSDANAFPNEMLICEQLQVSKRQPQSTHKPGKKRSGQAQPERFSEEALLTRLDNLMPLFGHVASSYNADIEEVRQEAALYLLTHGVSPLITLKYYLIQVVIGDRHTTKSIQASCSLDVPLNEDGDLTLADLLPDRCLGSEEDHARCDQKVAAVHEALRRLPLEEQKYLCEVYSIYGYEPTAPAEARFRRQGVESPSFEAMDEAARRRYRQNLCSQSRRHLLQDAQLISQVGLQGKIKASSYLEPTMNPSQRERLDRAYAELQAAGEKVTRDRLRQASGVDIRCVGSYLRKKKEGAASSSQLK